MDKVNYRDTTTVPTDFTLEKALDDLSALTDAQLAFQVAMILRTDLDHVSQLIRGRNRILKLSAELWQTRQELAEARQELENYKTHGVNLPVEQQASRAYRSLADGEGMKPGAIEVVCAIDNAARPLYSICVDDKSPEAQLFESLADKIIKANEPPQRS